MEGVTKITIISPNNEQVIIQSTKRVKLELWVTLIALCLVALLAYGIHATKGILKSESNSSSSQVTATMSSILINELFTTEPIQCPKGNGFCEDQFNTKACSYDWGDCCLPIIQDSLCKDCICFFDNTRHPSSAELSNILNSFSCAKVPFHIRG